MTKEPSRPRRYAMPLISHGRMILNHRRNPDRVNFVTLGNLCADAAASIEIPMRSQPDSSQRDRACNLVDCPGPVHDMMPTLQNTQKLCLGSTV